MALNYGGGGKKKSTRFNYQPRSREDMEARKNRSSSAREGIFKDDVKFFVTKDQNSKHTIRILPPTWDDPKHYGLDLWVHYGIGPDQSAYLCAHKMMDEPCACCDARKEAAASREQELAQALEPRSRIAFYLIDRNKEEDGPLLWSAPPGLDKEILTLAEDERTHEYVNLDDPEEGYDVMFTVTGRKPNIKYEAVKIARNPSPLSDDERSYEDWLQYIKENPIPDQLIFRDYDYIQKQLEGGVRLRDETDGKGKPGGDSDKEDRPSRWGSKPGRNEDEQEEERPRGSSGKPGSEEEETDEIDVSELTWESVHEMDDEALEALIKQERIPSKDIERCESLEEVQDVVCQRLGIEQEEEEKPRRGKPGAAATGKPSAREPYSETLKRLRKGGKKD